MVNQRGNENYTRRKVIPYVNLIIELDVIDLISDVYIAAVARTPLGGFNGSLASLSAIKLGSIAVEGNIND